MITPTQEYARTSFKNPKALLKGLDVPMNRILGAYRRRGTVLESLARDAAVVDDLERECKDLTDHQLQEKLRENKEIFRRGGRRQEVATIQALAAVREAAARKVGLRAFRVQLLGALALHRGFLAEMATGEGKTLTAGLAAVLAGWSAKPCHIITVNDYLVQRDAHWLEPLYHFCGLSVGFVTGAMSPEERRKGYACDITYTTSKEVVADFLRDSLAVKALRHPSRRLIRRMLVPSGKSDERLVMRGLHIAIVDEADSVLIDEAVTPLIISATQKNDALKEVVQLAERIADPLQESSDYTVNVRYREVELTESGRHKLDESCARLPGLWRGPSRRSELIKQALVAREFYRLGKQYVISEGRVVIVDEFTGRPMPQRTWRQGMHQAIEAKEHLSITDPNDTIARLSFQRFFRLYYRLSGMTGTAREAADEFWQLYELPVVRIPPNKPCIRQEQPDRLFLHEEAKWQAIADEIDRIHALRRPILIGTRSVAASENLAERLSSRGLHFRLLNAVRHQEEAQIVAEAGLEARITIATNMAGRGTDIKLGHGVAELGGLHVIATERHESRRVDRQLFGRAARQGDPGSAQALVSLDDELFRRHLPAGLLSRLRQWHASQAPGAASLARAALNLAQRNAQRAAFRQRKSVLRMDDWMEESLSFAGSDLS